MIFNLAFPNLSFAHKYDEHPVANDEFKNHYHMIYEMLLFIRGDAEFVIENRRFLLNPGDLLFISPGQHHSITVNPNIPYERYVINFPEYEIPKKLLNIVNNKNGCHTTETTIIPRLFTTFDTHVENYHGNDLAGLLKCVLREILYYCCSESKPYEAEIYNEKMIEVINYINLNIAKNFTLEEICEHFHYSKSYICKEFKQCMNAPIMKYIRTKKILLADSLIKNGSKPIEIYEQCGFLDYSTFFRAYKKIIGKSPSENKI